MQTVNVEISPHDLRWIAQTVHQAYHLDGSWQTCQKVICQYIFTTLDAHDHRIHTEFAPADVPFQRIWSR